MPPQEQEPNQVPQFTPPEQITPPEQPVETIPQSDAPAPLGRGKKPPIIVLAILAVILLAAGSYFVFFRKDDTTSQSQTPEAVTAENTEEQAAAPEGCPEGFTQFEGNNIGLHFCYPASWGNASLEETGEQAHAAKGNQYKIVFSRNSSVYGGIMSTDWQHNDMGHDGGDWAGSMSFAQLQEAKNYVKAAYVYTDTDEQFAFIDICSEFCQRGDEAYLQLTYGTKIPDNDRFEVVVFYQKVEFGDEFREVDALKDPGNPIEYVSIDKVEAADLTKLLPKSDGLFTALQQVANTVRGN